MTDPAIRTAAYWSARLRSENCTPDEKRRFASWLSEHPRNREVFALMSGVWDASATFDAPAERARKATRRKALLGGFGALAALGAPASEAGPVTVRTGTGERRRYAPQPGTNLLLDTQSIVLVPSRKGGDHASLVTGRIAMTQAVSASTFLCHTAFARLLPSAGEYDVELLDGGMAATVLDGTLGVAPAAPFATAAMTLARGQRLTFAPGAPPRLDRPSPDDLRAWRDGRVTFRDTPLSQAIAEMNRYTTLKIRLASPEIGTWRISGLYHTSNVEGFIHALTRLLPVRAEGRSPIVIMKL